MFHLPILLVSVSFFNSLISLPSVLFTVSFKTLFFSSSSFKFSKCLVFCSSWASTFDLILLFDEIFDSKVAVLDDNWRYCSDAFRSRSCAAANCTVACWSRSLSDFSTRSLKIEIWIRNVLIQVNLCQKHSFLHVLTQNMTTDCLLNYEISHRDLEQMEPKVISLTPSEGGKLVILLHNST